MSTILFWIYIAVMLGLHAVILVHLGGAALFAINGYRDQGGKKLLLLLLSPVLLCLVTLPLGLIPFGGYLLYAACIYVASRGPRENRFQRFALLGLACCILAFGFAAEAFQSDGYKVELGFYGGFNRFHDLYLKTSSFPYFTRHPSLSAVHDSAHAVFGQLVLSLVLFGLSGLCSCIALAQVWVHRREAAASGGIMAFCILVTSTGWFIILVMLVPITGQARGRLEVPEAIELPVMEDQREGLVLLSRLPSAKESPLQEEVHVFVDADGQWMTSENGGALRTPEALLASLVPRLGIRDDGQGGRWNTKTCLVAIDARAQPESFLPALHLLREAGVHFIRIVGRCVGCSIKHTHGIDLAWPGQCRLTLRQDVTGWHCNGVPADKVDAGPGDRNDRWKGKVAVDISQVGQWSEVTDFLDQRDRTSYPVALLLPGGPPEGIEKPR